MFILSSRSLERREGVDPELIAVNDLALKICPIDFGIPEHGGSREAEEQNGLYKDGFSKADGYKILSNHQPAEDGFSKALDYYAFVNGKASWESHHLAVVAAAHLQAGTMLGVSLNSGMFWPRKVPKYKNGIPYGWDMAHLELS